MTSIKPRAGGLRYRHRKLHQIVDMPKVLLALGQLCKFVDVAKHATVRCLCKYCIAHGKYLLRNKINRYANSF